jgi:hypothetical protein
MISQKQLDRSGKVLEEVISRAWDDVSFKNELIANPRATITEVAGDGFKFPESQNIVVEDQSDESVIYLNIPRKVSIDNMELTEEQLEAASGGILITATLVAVGGIALGFGSAAVLDKYF